MSDAIERIGIIGGGAWGTALATAARRAGRNVVLWAREAVVVSAINETHENSRFLPGVSLDKAIRATGALGDATDADALLLVTPAQHMRAVCNELARDLRPQTPMAICAKGIEDGTSALMGEVVGECLPAARIAVLSGPTFAAEVARDLPSAVTLAASDIRLAAAFAEAMGSTNFRPYLSDDPVGAQVGGAVKNVLAIACGIARGRGMGQNAGAALVTRGLAEMARLGLALGAKRETLMGLSGLGDLVLTCTHEMSRNFSLGVALGCGEALADYVAGRITVAEGVASAAAVVALAARHGVEMPISAAVDAVLNRSADMDLTIAGLLARPIGGESG
jgi:glycerol-3-phosphate dehydrogenase (NAD(P)+)